MIVVDFLLMEHKIHHDHEDAVRAMALGGRIAVGHPPAPPPAAELSVPGPNV